MIRKGSRAEVFMMGEKGEDVEWVEEGWRSKCASSRKREQGWIGKGERGGVLDGRVTFRCLRWPPSPLYPF
jgi:hypothetical protein